MQKTVARLHGQFNIMKEVMIMYAIDPVMSFAQVVAYYEQYVEDTKNDGKKPVSFLRFVTGRY